MPYVENRVVHDADSHLMELSDCLDAFLDPKFRAAYDELPKLKAWPRDGKLPKWANAQQDNPDFRAGAGREHPPAQELRSARRVPQAGPAARTRPARLLEPADLHDLVPGQFRARRHEPGARLCDGCGAQTHDGGFLRGGPPLLRDSLYPARRCRADLADGTRGDRAGPEGASHSLALPERPFAEPCRVRAALGDGGGGRLADRLPCRRRGEAEPRLFRQRPAPG